MLRLLGAGTSRPRFQRPKGHDFQRIKSISGGKYGIKRTFCYCLEGLNIGERSMRNIKHATGILEVGGVGAVELCHELCDTSL